MSDAVPWPVDMDAWTRRARLRHPGRLPQVGLCAMFTVLHDQGFPVQLLRRKARYWIANAYRNDHEFCALECDGVLYDQMGHTSWAQIEAAFCQERGLRANQGQFVFQAVKAEPAQSIALFNEMKDQGKRLLCRTRAAFFELSAEVLRGETPLASAHAARSRL